MSQMGVETPGRPRDASNRLRPPIWRVLEAGGTPPRRLDGGKVRSGARASNGWARAAASSAGRHGAPASRPRNPAASDALLAAVKMARVSSFRTLSQEAR